MNGRQGLTLGLTRGLPASGKTDMCRVWVDADPEHRVRINRDDLRVMMHGRRLGKPWAEHAVTIGERAMVDDLLADGWSVAIDATNLADEYVDQWGAVAIAAGARFEIWDLRDVPLGTCIKRDAMRIGPSRVGEEVIRAMHAKHLAPDTPPTITPAIVDPVPSTG